jgi:hypothetical protein
MVLLLLLSLLALILLSGDGVPDAASRLACTVCAASVACMMHVPRVMTVPFLSACFFLS